MTSEYISNMLRTAFGNTIIKLLNSSDITEIMLNTDGKLWAESLNKGLFYTNKTLSTSQANAIIKLIAARKNLIINKEHPEISCELPENSARFQGFLPPITENPSFTIRKKATRIFTLDD